MVRILLVAWFVAWAAALASGAERRIGVEADAKQVKRYAKIEFTLRVDAVGDNPYDPDQIDLGLEIVQPSGKKVFAPAFCFQPFERRPLSQGGNSSEWMYPTGPAVWKVRFAPIEAGRHTCTAILKDRAGTARSDALTFECLPADGRGFVRVSKTDPRYLEFDDGTPFFAIGQNIAFVYNAERNAAMLRKLGENGANFARVWACAEDWAMAVEARKSAWGRSWAWNPPFVIAPDRDGYHSGRLCLKLTGDAGATLDARPCHPVALRPNTRYVLSGRKVGDEVSLALDRAQPRNLAAQRQWTPFKEEFTTSADQWWLRGPTFRLTAKGTAWLGGLSLKEAGGGPELLWEADPNRPILGVYNQPDCFQLDHLVDVAEQSGVYLQVVLLTRDHYMSMLSRDGKAYDDAIASARRLMRYAAARWGYSTHIATWEYFNEMNPGLPTDRFYSEMAAALDASDVNQHLRANSTWSSLSKDLRHPRLDTADLHYYIRPSTKDLWKDEVESVVSRWKIMQRELGSPRPLLFSEFGITNDNWQRAPELDKDKEFIHLHNALWASAMSGFASTVCHWYWDDIHRRDLYPHYGPISRFTADIPWTTGKLRPASATCDKPVRILGLAGESGAYLWLFDPQATWWSVAVDGRKPAAIEGASIAVNELPAGRYRVEWWDTRQGKVIQSAEAQSATGPVKVAVPAFTADIACRIVRIP